MKKTKVVEEENVELKKMHESLRGQAAQLERADDHARCAAHLGHRRQALLLPLRGVTFRPRDHYRANWPPRKGARSTLPKQAVLPYFVLRPCALI